MKDFMPPSPENHEKALKSFYVKERELWAGCIWYPVFRSMLDREIKVVTLSENLEFARDVGLNVGDSLDEALSEALAKHGEDASIAFVPFGRYTVFDV
jgi:hypothetical protein